MEVPKWAATLMYFLIIFSLGMTAGIVMTHDYYYNTAYKDAGDYIKSYVCPRQSIDPCFNVIDVDNISLKVRKNDIYNVSDDSVRLFKND